MTHRPLAIARLAVSCVIISQLSFASFACATGISNGEGLRLLKVYLKSQGYQPYTADFEIDPSTDSVEGFYLYGAFVDTPDRVVTIGYYGINAETGDLWERVGCERLEAKAIVQLQKKIRDASGLSAKELERERKMNPCFDTESP